MPDSMEVGPGRNQDKSFFEEEASCDLQQMIREARVVDVETKTLIGHADMHDTKRGYNKILATPIMWPHQETSLH